MKIAQVVCTFPPYKGGIGNLAYDYALGMTEMGHEVEVFCPNYQKLSQELPVEFKIHRLTPLLKFGNGAFLPQLLWKLSKFDLIHLHYPFFGGAEIVWLLKLFKRKKMKLVVSYHMDNFGSGLLGLIFKLNSKIFMPFILKSADKVLCSSYDYIRHTSAHKVYYKNKIKFKSLSPSVDTNRFFPDFKNEELMKKYQLTGLDKVVLFVGGLDKAHYFKGIEFLLNSWKDLNLPQSKLLIVGQGSLRDKYKQQAFKLGLHDSVIFSKIVSNSQLPDHYNLADVLVLPSIDSSEAFGIVLIEAMACGKPVIASDLPGVRSVVADGVNGYLFKVKDKNQLLAKIRLILQNKEKQNKLGVSARQTTENTYSREYIIKRLESIYLDLI